MTDTITVYGPSLLLAVGALMIGSPQPVRRVFYLAVFLGSSIFVALMVGVLWRDVLGICVTTLAPAVVIAAIRLVAAFVVRSSSVNE
ncbi:hypothetical protein [Sphaerisporangium fuscum]|uniref:hypothetical protein n=1 Tax=Sphaerisporangium fuscum TaxID=2835868 RepID=UPI001BDBC49E|nr:hypothetical protein [Sphaerisporangium fuscum]